MGRVYAAQGPDGAAVALKVVHPHLVADADALARFRREAAVGVSIRHRNVVATLDAGEDGGRHWLALEYVEGQTLHSLQEELGTVPEELCRHVAHEVAAVLAAIHAAGIVHRDMKPENVLITRDQVVKVMDLGVARGAEDDSRVTQTGAFVGSLQYAAPEQFTGGGKGLDGRADLHALGVAVSRPRRRELPILNPGRLPPPTPGAVRAGHLRRRIRRDERSRHRPIGRPRHWTTPRLREPSTLPPGLRSSNVEIPGESIP